jgi:hypothetical protein
MAFCHSQCATRQRHTRQEPNRELWNLLGDLIQNRGEEPKVVTL